jgi:hypothetical protein
MWKRVHCFNEFIKKNTVRRRNDQNIVLILADHYNKNNHMWTDSRHLSEIKHIFYFRDLATWRHSGTRAVCKVRGLTLLFRVGTLWRCGDGLFFEVPPLTSGALLTTLNPLLENVIQTVCRTLQEDSVGGGFDLGAPFSWLKKPRNRVGRDLDCMVDVLMGFHLSRWAHLLPLFNRATLTLH